MIKKYVKKPVEVEAIQLDLSKNIKEVLVFIGEVPSVDWSPCCAVESDKWYEYIENIKENGLTINTLEGNMLASDGDFVIKGISGEFYPCKPDIFEQTYQEI